MAILRRRFWSQRDHKYKTRVYLTILEWRNMTDKQKARYLKLLHSFNTVDKAYKLLTETFPEVQIYKRMPEATKCLLFADIQARSKGKEVQLKRREKLGIVPPLVESLFAIEIKRIRSLRRYGEQE